MERSHVLGIGCSDIRKKNWMEHQTLLEKNINLTARLRVERQETDRKDKIITDLRTTIQSQKIHIQSLTRCVETVFLPCLFLFMLLIFHFFNIATS